MYIDMLSSTYSVEYASAIIIHAWKRDNLQLIGNICFAILFASYGAGMSKRSIKSTMLNRIRVHYATEHRAVILRQSGSARQVKVFKPLHIAEVNRYPMSVVNSPGGMTVSSRKFLFLKAGILAA